MEGTDKLCIHLNTHVYELVFNGTEYKALSRQRNNPFVLESVHLNTVEAWNSDLIDDITLTLKTRYPELGEPVIYTLYPCSSKEQLKNQHLPAMVIHGVYREQVPVDMEAPIVTSGDLEERAAALQRALTPKYLLTPMVMIIPLSPKYMVDVTLSFAPETAVTDLTEIKTSPIEDLDEIMTPPMTIDPMMPTVSEKEMACVKNLADYIEKRAEEFKKEKDLSPEELAEMLNTMDYSEFCAENELTSDELRDMLARLHEINRHLDEHKK